jgi:hypothetical protein
MKPSERPWCAVLSAAGIPVSWWLAVVLTGAWRCGAGVATEVAYFTVLMVAAVPIAALISIVVVRAWKGPFPLGKWSVACCAVAFGIAIYGVFAVVNQGGCDMDF